MSNQEQNPATPATSQTFGSISELQLNTDSSGKTVVDTRTPQQIQAGLS